MEPAAGHASGWQGWPKYIRHEFFAQVKAVFPVTAFLFMLEQLVLGHLESGWVQIMLALLTVAVGLQFFMFGLFHGLLPLGKRMGTCLPEHLSLRYILVIAFFMGVLVTYAEPALEVVQVLGQFVDYTKSPYLAWLLSSHGSGWLTLAVATGVGIAVVVGLLRIHHNHRLASIIYGLVFVTLSLTLYVDLCTDKSEVIGLAWDLGAVTTGPVTVPMVLAIGMGLTKGMGRAPSPDQSFGVVTLASLFPVCTVLLLAIWLPQRSHHRAPGGDDGPGGEWPIGIGEAVEATQSLLPLLCFVFGILKWVLKQRGLMSSTTVRHTDHGADEDEGTDNEKEIAGRAQGAPLVHITKSLFCVWIGLVLFALGMEYGLSPLGDNVGAALPGLFTFSRSVHGSPVYSHTVGVALCFGAAFCLGFGATLAEPALQAMAVTVEELTHHHLSVNDVILSVALGVGSGLALGVLKLVYKLKLSWMLYTGYLIALVLTSISEDTMINIAWDSAGVTTDAITVPMVLALGSGFGGSLSDADTFGLLALASVGPIISVLACALVRKRMSHRASYIELSSHRSTRSPVSPMTLSPVSPKSRSPITPNTVT
uniref:DUF1538 domain-containing protein n=1 Tax=Eutreptiella gymnastica TaxID=73025 RepID=A0A7S1NQD2_9EUGL